MTSSQRPEVVECKKLPTCDRKKKERERRKKKNFVPPTEHARLPFLPSPPFWLSLPGEPRNGVVCAVSVWLRILFCQRSGF